MDRRAIAQRERMRRKRGSYRPADPYDMRIALAKLEHRIEDLEANLAGLGNELHPEPDVDDGWTELEAGGRIEWRPDDPKRQVSRVDVLRKTGPDSFAPVHGTRHEGEGVWWRAHPTVSGGRLLYNITRDPVTVRVQAWYG